MTKKILVNGKILYYRVTGVQRYLIEIAARVGTEIEQVMPGRSVGGMKGHAWEQCVLPARIGGNLLWSPSNTGPLAVARQVVTIHDVVPLDHPEWLNAKFAAWYQFLLPRLVRRVRHVIAISEFTKQRILATTNIGAEKITVIPNGVDPRFQPGQLNDIILLQWNLGLPSPHYVLSVGSLEPRKNLRRLLAAWRIAHARLPQEVWLVIAGAKGKEIVFSGATGVEALPPRVHVAGYIPEQWLPALYAGAKAFAYVSEYEGFGLPPLEAMACGVPVLVSNGTAFPEVVGDAGLYVDPKNIDDIADGLVTITAETGLAAEFAARGVARAKLFSWDRTAAETMRVLQEAAKE